MLDLGSNSFHLLVADAGPDGGIDRVATRKLTLRLAEPVAAHGRLGEDATERAEAALAELFGEAQARGAGRVAAVATDAIRQAEDGPEFCERVRCRFGVPVRVLEGLEEAGLALRGIVVALRLDQGEDLLGLDLGGGSFEVGYGGRDGLSAGASLPLGSATLAAATRHDPPRLAERAALHERVLAQLRPLAEQVVGLRGNDQPLRVAGTAGTIRDLGRVSLGLAEGTAPRKIRGLAVTRDQLERAYARLVACPSRERLDLPGVGEKRVDLLPAGGVVLLATLEAFGAERFQLCDWGLREGALLDALAGRGVLGEEDFVALWSGRRPRRTV